MSSRFAVRYCESKTSQFLTDALLTALTDSESIIIAGTTVAVLRRTLDTGITTTEIVDALNALSDAGTIAAITWTNDGDVITGTYDTAGAIANTGQ